MHTTARALNTERTLVARLIGFNGPTFLNTQVQLIMHYTIWVRSHCLLLYLVCSCLSCVVPV